MNRNLVQWFVSLTLKSAFDGLIYGLLTGGTSDGYGRASGARRAGSACHVCQVL